MTIQDFIKYELIFMAQYTYLLYENERNCQ